MSVENFKRLRGTMARGIVASFLGMLVVACSGCGGGGDGSSQPAQASVAASRTNVVIDAEGDSTMYGLEKDAHGVAFQTANSAPAVLQSVLSQEFTPTKITVINNGVPSASVADSLAGSNAYYTDPLEKRLAQMSAQIVIENYGINDAQRVTTDQFYTNLTTWVQRVLQAGKIPVLEEPNPVCRPGIPDLEPYVGIINQVAYVQGLKVIKQYDYILSLPNWQSMLTDCVHPNDALYAIKANREAQVLDQVVQQVAIMP